MMTMTTSMMVRCCGALCRVVYCFRGYGCRIVALSFLLLSAKNIFARRDPSAPIIEPPVTLTHTTTTTIATSSF